MFNKVTLYVRKFAAKIFSNLVAGNFLSCIVFITFFIFMASANQVERCDKTFVMFFAHARQWSRVDYHCVKSLRIRSYSGPYFPTFELNNSE